MGTHDKYWNNYKDFENLIDHFKIKKEECLDNKENKVKDIIKKAKHYRDTNKGTHKYVENKQVFEDTLLNILDKYYENHDIDEWNDYSDKGIDCSKEDCTEEEMQDLYKKQDLYEKFYSSEPEYDNKCNQDCYTCKAKSKNKTLKANNQFTNNEFTLVISDKYLHLNRSRKINWFLKDSNTNKTYIIGSGHIYRYAEQETTIEDIEKINTEVNNILLTKFNNFILNIVYNNVDITELIDNSSLCVDFNPATKLSDLM